MTMTLMAERDSDSTRESNGKGRRSRRVKKEKSAYFLRPVADGQVAVFRRPAGNRIEPKECGVMPSRAAAAALVQQLQQAESVVYDLFLEATDDGIEALEAVLFTCRRAVLQRYEGRDQQPRGEGRRRRRRRGNRGGQGPQSEGGNGRREDEGGSPYGGGEPAADGESE